MLLFFFAVLAVGALDSAALGPGRQSVPIFNHFMILKVELQLPSRPQRANQADLCNEVNERHGSQLLDVLLVEAGQVVELGLLLGVAAGVECAIL